MERVAIIGTAQSFTLTPWDDPGLHLISLNDAYRLPNFKRADCWYDIHPLDKFIVAPQDGRIYAHQVPAGHYVRPSDHLQWLGRQAQTIPVWLHPDYRAQCADAVNWPRAQAFPRAEIEATFGTYETSSPAWILAHQLTMGAKEVHMYGIHLATEHEYIEQRPNMEFLLGRVLGPSKVTITVKDGVRRFETKDGMVVLPEASPLLSSDFQYGFQTRPRTVLEPLKWEIHKVAVKKNRATQQLIDRSWWQPRGGLRQELARLTALDSVLREQLTRAEMGV